MNRTALSASIAALLLCACGGGENGSDGGGSYLSTYAGTVDGSERSFRSKSETALTQADGGVRIEMSGDADDEEFSLAAVIAGGAGIDIPDDGEDVVYASALNVRLDLADVSYRGTSGGLTLTAFGPDAGDRITGTMDFGLVRMDGVPGSATLKGDLDLIVRVPSP